ncbi:MAG: hypothetical protein U1D30_14915 [Planctomycetota bacterium]
MEIGLAIFGSLAVLTIVLAIIYFVALREKPDGANSPVCRADRHSILSQDGLGRGVSIAELELFTQGRSRQVLNLLRGETRSVQLSLFDYQYVTGSGKNATTHKTTALLIRSPSLMLPRFTLKPENFFHRIGTFFGLKDINFEEHPEFSRKYLLKGKNEEAVRALFVPSRLEFFEGTNGTYVEGDGDQLVFCRPGERVDPDKLRSFLEEGFAIYSQLSG